MPVDWVTLIAVFAGVATTIGIIHQFFRNFKIDLDKNMEKIDKRMDSFEKKFEKIERRLDSHAQRIDQSYKMFVDLLKERR